MGSGTWNRTTCQTPSTRNYRLMAAFRITRQMVVSGNRCLMAIFTQSTVLLKQVTQRTLTAIGQYTCVARENNRELLVGAASGKFVYLVRNQSSDSHL